MGGSPLHAAALLCVSGFVCLSGLLSPGPVRCGRAEPSRRTKAPHRCGQPQMQLTHGANVNAQRWQECYRLG
jgi:hypothetical protein